MGTTDRSVVMDVPAWMWGGNPARLLDEADVVVRHRGRGTAGLSGPGGGQWRVQTQESYQRRRADLVSYRLVAGPGRARPDFDYLTSRGASAHDVTGSSPEVVAAVADRARRSGRLVDVLNYVRLHLSVVSSADLAATAAHHYDELGKISVEGDPTQRPLEARGIHAIERSQSMLWRMKVPFILHRISHDPQMRAGTLSHLPATDVGLSFQSSSGLADGAYLMDAYVGPLAASMTPFLWALAAPRSWGNVMVTLGHPLAGTVGEAAEMLQLIHVGGADRELPAPHLSPTASGEAVKWWSVALNDLFAVVTDFSAFAASDDGDRRYRPERHLHTILTLEQLFRRVTSGLVGERDTNARRVLMFTALDTLERLTRTKLEKYADLGFAKATLRHIESAVWPGAGEVLLPAARRAVAALEELQDGFFLHRQLGRDVVEVPVQGGTTTLTPTQAAAWYVKALRDATHGHGSNKTTAAARTDALLAHHNGRVPHDLGLLSYLYLLELLTRPDRLRRVLAGA